MKRLIICCDGTWQDLSAAYPTNVVKMAQIIRPIALDGTTQIIYYQSGLGTEHGEAEKILGGVFGWGIDTNIQDAYRFLCLNYEPGDEVYLFGFSRGAYTVRSLAGLIYCSGLLQRPHIRKVPQAYDLYRDRNIPPSHPKAISFRQQYGENITIKLLACWDTVGELGVPELIPLASHWINARYQFHDTQLNRRIEFALHAVAIDERRKVFNVTPMTTSKDAKTSLIQVWFPGTHTSVGGGQEEASGLADAALEWTMESIRKLGLGLEFVANPGAIADGGIQPNYRIPFNAETDDMFLLGGLIYRDLKNPGCSSTIPVPPDRSFFDRNIHLSAKRRWKLTEKPLYRPKNLDPYQQWFNAFAE
ncbi:DUF2235 domain-containing protein [Scytonema sp. NUACC26]|uniref:DUF2235 domain-containing protein n=1 Tax=Scytonema sp. NUACC26 TaxID=3140176 RepID=UPI0034DBE398